MSQWERALLSTSEHIAGAAALSSGTANFEDPIPSDAENEIDLNLVVLLGV